MPLNPQHTYVQLTAQGKAIALPGGDAFWSLPAAALDRLGQGWLISEYAYGADWGNWEMHPNGDEFVYLLTGAIDLVLEESAGPRTESLRASGAVLVPRGVWHTANVQVPSRVLHVTLGAGTLHRPR
jgi:mannose-6-phosphate isomerase-like protein (cupin superfamily)